MLIVNTDVNTTRMQFHYRTHGQPGGLPLLLLHGSYGSSRWWESLFEVLPEEIYCVAPDLRGCGESEKANNGYAIEEQAEDIAAFVQAVNLRHFNLLAHSTSGAIAMEFALRYPDQAVTLILVDSVPVEGVFTPVDTLLLLEQMKHDRELLAQALAALMPTINPASQPAFTQWVADAQTMAQPAFTAIADSLNQWNRFSDAKHLTLPTLLLWGDQDTIVERDAITRTLIAIPGAANLEVLPNCGHSPMIEVPLLLAERVVEFITQDFVGFDEIRQSVEKE